MFLDYLKNFMIKKAIRKSLSANIVSADVHKIITVGVVLDQTFSKFIPKLKLNLIAYGILEENIEFIVRASPAKADAASKYNTFNTSDVTWNGTFSDEKIEKFIESDFDLLINYYDQKKPVLMLVSSLSRANFKVGFATIDKRVNNLIIDASAEEYSIFDQELFKYLKILNTI